MLLNLMGRGFRVVVRNVISIKSRRVALQGMCVVGGEAERGGVLAGGRLIRSLSLWRVKEKNTH